MQAQKLTLGGGLPACHHHATACHYHLLQHCLHRAGGARHRLDCLVLCQHILAGGRHWLLRWGQAMSERGKESGWFKVWGSGKHNLAGPRRIIEYSFSL